MASRAEGGGAVGAEVAAGGDEGESDMLRRRYEERLMVMEW